MIQQNISVAHGTRRRKKTAPLCPRLLPLIVPLTPVASRLKMSDASLDDDDGMDVDAVERSVMSLE